MSKIQVFDLMMPEDEEKFLKGGDLVVIKVSGLEKLYQEEYAKLDKELSWKVNSYSRAEVMAKKELLEQLLTALDGKEGQ